MFVVMAVNTANKSDARMSSRVTRFVSLTSDVILRTFAINCVERSGKLNVVRLLGSKKNYGPHYEHAC